MPSRSFPVAHCRSDIPARDRQTASTVPAGDPQPILPATIRPTPLRASVARAPAAGYADGMTQASSPVSPFREPPDLGRLNALSVGTAMQPLAIVFTEAGPDYLRATMPVDARTRQPYGLLHGGASALLAETLGSTAGKLCVAPDRLCVGLEINANHLRAVRDGTVTGTARPLHVGARTQVWDIRIEDERGRLVCISRLTLAVIDRPR